MKNIFIFLFLLPFVTFAQFKLIHIGAKASIGISSFVNYTFKDIDKQSLIYFPGFNYGFKAAIGKKKIRFFCEFLYNKEKIGLQEIVDTIKKQKTFEFIKTEIPVGIRIVREETVIELGCSYVMLSKMIENNINDISSPKDSNNFNNSYYNCFITVGKLFCKKHNMSINVRYNCSLSTITKNGYPFIKNDKIHFGSIFLSLEILL